MSGLGNKEIMARNIQHYMALKGKSRKEVCEAIGVKYTTFTDWVKGSAYPRIDKIELMANYFDISKSDLVEEKNMDENNISITNAERDIIMKYRSLDDRGKQSIIDTLNREYSYVEVDKPL